MLLCFARYCTTNFRKMTFMAVNMALTGALMIVLPFVKNFGLLVTFRFLQVTVLSFRSNIVTSGEGRRGRNRKSPIGKSLNKKVQQ